MKAGANTFYRNKTRASLSAAQIAELKCNIEGFLRGEISISERSELSGVLTYLNAYVPSDDFGRDMQSEKHSFSTAEMARAFFLQPEQQKKYLIYRYRFNEYPRRKVHNPFPIVLSLEPVSACNLRCTMCFQIDPRLSKDKKHLGVMKMDLYRELIEEAGRHGLASLVLASRGEPTLHPQLPEMIRLAKAAGILEVKVNTNATKLNEKLSRALLDAAPEILVFSVDAASKEPFERIRVGANFDEVVANIDRFHEIRRNEYPESMTTTRISMLDLGDDTLEAESFWAPRVDEFSIGGVSDLLNVYDGPVLEDATPCTILWERLFIGWDGTVNPCDNDYLFELAFAKIGNGVSIESVWNSEKMKTYRGFHEMGKKSQLHPCGRCHGR